jgi:hypothetical protein
MNRDHLQRLVEARRAADQAALNGARRLRRRERTLVELYLAEISSDPRRRTLAPEWRLDYPVPLSPSPDRDRQRQPHDR